MHDIWVSLAAFAVTAGIFTMSPGPDTATVLRTSTTSGPKHGFLAALGIALGLLVWGLSAAFGLTALLAASEIAFNVVKWAGAAYLFCIGLRMLLQPRTGFSEEGGSRLTNRSPYAGFRQGLTTNLLNPKAGLFYITFLPQFIPHGVNVILFSLLLAACHALMALCWFTILTLLTVPFSHLLTRPVVVRRLDRLTGCIFMGFGLKLALSERH